MKYLLDTHAFLWATSQSSKLPKNVVVTITDPQNDIFISAISFWQIAIKVRSGRLDIGKYKPGELPVHASNMGFLLLGLLPDEAATTGQLAENTHFDPFDRMLIWQAIQRKLVLVSGDQEFSKFKKHGLKTLWK